MRRFTFQFEALLTVRRNHREKCERAVIEARKRVTELEGRRQQTIADRTDQLDQLRRLGESGHLDVDAASRRRYFASQLMVDIARLDRERDQAEAALRICQQALIKADQGVKVLEKLEEKQREEFRFAQDARTQRELEDAWRGPEQRA